MSIIGRIRVLWLGFWSHLLSGSEARHVSLVGRGSLEAQKQQVRRIREALTNLIYQKKRLGDQASALEGEMVELQKDVRQAASEDRDELALNLIARLETAEEEHRFLKNQLEVLDKDIGMARETEAQLVREIHQAEATVGTMVSRYKALKVRRELQSELQSVSKVLSSMPTKGNSALADQIRRLEAEMETMQTERLDWEKEWQAMRAGRQEGRHHDLLRQIKENMKRRALPTEIMMREPAR